ncbi:MAG: IS701 family transposase, partial [Nitrosotalea sp.]
MTAAIPNAPKLPAELQRWLPELHQFFRAFEDLLEIGARAEETRANARAYLLGLLAAGERKSMEPLAQRTGVPPDRLQNFITYSPWDWQLVQTRLVQKMTPRFATAMGVLALDDTEFPKQGRASVGVGAQYCGVLGKVANCQVAVSLQYVRPDAEFHPNLSSFSLGMELYLPESWIEDPARRERVRIPDAVEFRPKGRIALDLIDRARGLKVPFRAAVADAGYGTSGPFRRALRDRKIPYVMAVQPEQTQVLVPSMGDEPLSCSEVAKRIPTSRWGKVRWASGSQGPMVIESTRVRVTVTERGKPSEERGWLIFEKRSNETKAYVVWGLDKLPLVEQLRIQRSRWPIEQSYQHMKEELGMDHFEGRSWLGWHHHVTLVALAQAFLMAVRSSEVKKGRKLPTIPNVRKYLQARVAAPLLNAALDEGEREERKRRILYLTEVFAIPIRLRN